MFCYVIIIIAQASMENKKMKRKTDNGNNNHLYLLEILSRMNEKDASNFFDGSFCFLIVE
jgi:hypothetical protein